MTDSVAEYVAAQLGNLAQREAKKPRPPRQIPPSEQIARFLSGAEKQRVLSGEITPAQYARYQVAMLKKLQGQGALELEV